MKSSFTYTCFFSRFTKLVEGYTKITNNDSSLIDFVFAFGVKITEFFSSISLKRKVVASAPG